MQSDFNLNPKQFNSFINELPKASKFQDPVFDVYENKVEARERTTKKTSFLFSKQPIKQLDIEEVDDLLQSHAIKIGDDANEKKTTLKSLNQSIKEIGTFLKNPKLENEKYNQLVDLKHSLEVVNNFLNPKEDAHIENPIHRHTLKSLIKDYSLGMDEKEWDLNENIIYPYIEDEEGRLTKDFNKLIDQLLSLKASNEKIFKGEVNTPFPLDRNVTNIHTLIYTISSSPTQNKTLDDDAVRDHVKKLYSFLLDLFQSTGTLANTQLHNDSFLAALPLNIIKKSDPNFNEEGPLKRALDRAAEYEQIYIDAVNELKQKNPISEDLEKELKSLEFSRRYETTSSSFLFSKADWVDIEKTDSQPFISGKRLIGYMNPTKTKKREIEIKLDLKPLGPLSEAETVKVFYFLSEFSLGMSSYAKFVEEHHGKNDKLKDIPNRIRKELDTLDFLSEERKMQLLQIAMDFEDSIFYNSSKIRFELLN